jgi:hypothetical protein
MNEVLKLLTAELAITAEININVKKSRKRKTDDHIEIKIHKQANKPTYLSTNNIHRIAENKKEKKKIDSQ